MRASDALRLSELVRRLGEATARLEKTLLQRQVEERDATIRLLRYELADALNAEARANGRLDEMKKYLSAHITTTHLPSAQASSTDAPGVGESQR